MACGKLETLARLGWASPPSRARFPSRRALRIPSRFWTSVARKKPRKILAHSGASPHEPAFAGGGSSYLPHRFIMIDRTGRCNQAHHGRSVQFAWDVAGSDELDRTYSPLDS